MKHSPIFLSIILFISVTGVLGQQVNRPVAILVDQIGSSRPLALRNDVRSKMPTVSAPSSVAAVGRRAFELMNAERQAAGLSLLSWSDEAARLANMHAQNMAAGKFFSHKGLDGETVDGRAAQLGIRWSAIGENIATMRGYEDPASKAVDTWMNSSAHKRNILNGMYNRSAVGAAMADDGTVYFTQVFLSK